MQRNQKNHIESPCGLSLLFLFWSDCVTMELGLVFRNTLSHISHFLPRIFISHFYLASLSRIFISHFISHLAFLSRISHFYLASRIFISHFYLSFLSRIFISHLYLAFLSRISHFYLASRIFISHLTPEIVFSSFIKSHLECPLQASVIYSLH